MLKDYGTLPGLTSDLLRSVSFPASSASLYSSAHAVRQSRCYLGGAFCAPFLVQFLLVTFFNGSPELLNHVMPNITNKDASYFNPALTPVKVGISNSLNLFNYGYSERSAPNNYLYSSEGESPEGGDNQDYRKNSPQRKSLSSEGKRDALSQCGSGNSPVCAECGTCTISDKDSLGFLCGTCSGRNFVERRTTVPPLQFVDNGRLRRSSTGTDDRYRWDDLPRNEVVTTGVLPITADWLTVTQPDSLLYVDAAALRGGGVYDSAAVEAFDSVTRALSITPALFTSDTETAAPGTGGTTEPSADGAGADAAGASSRKAVIVIDWLTVRYENCTLDPLSFLEEFTQAGYLGDFTVKIGSNGNRQYAHNGYVWYKGSKFARFMVGARQENIKDTLLLTFENYVFYDKEIMSLGLPHFINRLGVALSCGSASINRLDLALDGLSDLSVVDKYYKGELDKKGQAKVSHMAHFNRKEQLFESLCIGSRKSGRYFRLYNKSLEIKTHQNGEKLHIDRFHTANNVGSARSSGDRYRAEFELGRSWLSKFGGGFTIAMLDNCESIKSLYNTAATAGDFLYFREPGSDTNTTRQKAFSLLGSVSITAPIYERIEKPAPDGTRSIKMAIRRLFFEAAAAPTQNLEDTFFETAIDLCRTRGLEAWLLEKYRRWLPELSDYAFGLDQPIERVSSILESWGPELYKQLHS